MTAPGKVRRVSMPQTRPLMTSTVPGSSGGVTFAVCLLLWVFEWVGGYETAAWAQVMSYLSVIAHFEPFSKGVIDTKDTIYFISLTYFGLFLSARSLESLRWRA